MDLVCFVVIGVFFVVVIYLNWFNLGKCLSVIMALALEFFASKALTMVAYSEPITEVTLRP